MNTMVVNNHIFQASKLKLQKYKRSHENARANGSHSNASIVPFVLDTLGDFCSVYITFLKAIAKTKFAKISNKAEVKELAASNWISTTCRDIQTAIIKTCAYNNRFALKCAFGESYIMICTLVQFILRLHMMSVFHQLLWVVDTIYLPSLVFSIMRISTHLCEIDYFSYFILLKSRNYHE